MGSGAPRVQYAVVSSRLVTGPAVPSELDLLRREYESSLSWRITRPLRAVGRIAREARSAAPPEAIARRDFTPGRYDSWLKHFHGDTLGRIDAACRGGGAECFALFRHLDVDLWALLLTQVAVGKSRSRKRAARLRRCTSEPSCTTPSRRTACVRRTRSPFSEPTLTGDPAGSPGVFPTATWASSHQGRRRRDECLGRVAGALLTLAPPLLLGESSQALRIGPVTDWPHGACAVAVSDDQRGVSQGVEPG